jgi:hypothetical protein
MTRVDWMVRSARVSSALPSGATTAWGRCHIHISAPHVNIPHVQIGPVTVTPVGLIPTPMVKPLQTIVTPA